MPEKNCIVKVIVGMWTKYLANSWNDHQQKQKTKQQLQHPHLIDTIWFTTQNMQLGTKVDLVKFYSQNTVAIFSEFNDNGKKSLNSWSESIQINESIYLSIYLCIILK